MNNESHLQKTLSNAPVSVQDELSFTITSAGRQIEEIEKGIMSENNIPYRADSLSVVKSCKRNKKAYEIVHCGINCWTTFRKNI